MYIYICIYIYVYIHTHTHIIHTYICVKNAIGTDTQGEKHATLFRLLDRVRWSGEKRSEQLLPVPLLPVPLLLHPSSTSSAPPYHYL